MASILFPTTHLKHRLGRPQPHVTLADVKILVVCAGNICRSPIGERLLARELGPDHQVSSAGTIAPRRHPMSAESADELRLLGVDPSGHRARPLTAAMAEDADLVLTMTRDLRSDVLTMAPIVLHRTFSWREFAALGGAIPTGESLKARVRSLSAQRASVADLDLDVPDPIGRPRQEYADAARMINADLDAIADQIRRLAG